jgi:hypothetical protein
MVFISEIEITDGLSFGNPAVAAVEVAIPINL